MIVVIRVLTVATMALVHSSCLLMMGNPNTFADLWFYYLLLFAVIPVALISLGGYLFLYARRKLSLGKNWPDAVFLALLTFQTLSILGTLRHWL